MAKYADNITNTKESKMAGKIGLTISILLVVLAFFQFSGCMEPPTSDETALECYYDGIDAYNTGNYKDASELLEYTVLKRPLINDAYHYLAMSYEKLKDFEKVQATAKKCLRIFHDDPVAQNLFSKSSDILRDKATINKNSN